MTKFTDVANLYLGCELMNVMDERGERLRLDSVDDSVMAVIKAGFVKPVLVHLKDMSYVHVKELNMLSDEAPIKGNFFNPRQFVYLLEKEYDLFGLIDNDLAIDKKSVNGKY